VTAETTSSLSSTLFLNELAALDPAWFLGVQTWQRANAAQTGGAVGLIEQVIGPGYASPYHVHHKEDEEFYVLEGQIRFHSQGNSWVAREGGFAFLPRYIPHGFSVEGATPARVLILVTPAGFEGFVADLSEHASPAGPPDMDKVMRVAAQYSIDILGILPE
jgi:quercetin dioxygenase-like cupin family protein